MTIIEKAKKKLLNWKKKWKNLGLKGMDSLNIKLNGSLDGTVVCAKREERILRVQQSVVILKERSTF